MKKFLIFLVSIVVFVCVGATTYYFLRNDETINFKTKEIYCNSGDVITLSELGFEHKKADKDTKINYNAGGEEVTGYVNYDASKGYYVVGQNGGDVTLVIKTSNKKFKEFKVNVHIGNGSEENPYYIDDETTLSKIGKAYGLDKCFELRNNIIVSNSFKTIGYNHQAEQWIGFSGKFFGNGYSISGLTLAPTDTEEVGLFSTINSGAVVTDLTIKNANIQADADFIGVLAGKVYGSISKIIVENSQISSTKANAQVGAVAGYIGNVSLTTTYSKNVSVSADGNNSIVGGFAGTIDQALVQACYASKNNLNANANSSIGGFVGKFIIGTTAGSIQQSYANATSSNANFAGFIGTIEQTADFDVNNTTMLRYLVGNVAVSNGTVVSTINVANNEDGSAFFLNFEDSTNGYYLITNYTTENDLILATDLVFYALDPETKVNWDANVWINENNALPELRMGSIAPAGVASEYITRSLNKVYVSGADSISGITSTNNKEFILQNDITLPSNWQPINLNNCTVNGNGKTIYFAEGGNIALFGNVENSTIKDLNLANVKTNVESSGALAHQVTSTIDGFYSTLENIHVDYIGESQGSNTFGGLVNLVSNSNINNCSVNGLNYVGDSFDVGGLVNQLNASTISNSTVNAVLTGKQMVGGIVGKNYSSTISKVNGSTVITFTTTPGNNVWLGGVVAQNVGSINEVSMNVKIDIQNSTMLVFAGGVTAENGGSITSTSITGEGIIISGNFDAGVVAGGVAGYNNGTISNTNCFINQVGTYREGKNDVVGGVAAYNVRETSKIQQVVMSADVYGNTVAGVAVYMNESASALVDQVLVAKFNKDTDEITENIIKGDAYVAGVAVNLSAGSISNIQARSNIIGGTNSTVSSLAVLIFPDGAIFNNSTIDSSFEGNGNFYMDTWMDYNNTALNLGTFSGSQNFNLYATDINSGSFQSVVINTEKASSKGVNGIKASDFPGGWIALYKKPDYEDTAESSYYKAVNNSQFADATTFKTNWYVKVENAGVFGTGLWSPKYEKEMTFDIGGVWAEGTGIKLAFLSNV